MSDKLDSTIDEVASRDRKVEIPIKKKEIEETKEEELIDVVQEDSRKRKFEETVQEVPSRPDTLENVKKLKIEEKVSPPVSRGSSQESTSNAYKPSDEAETSFNTSKIESSASDDSEPEEAPVESDSHREPSLTETDPMKIWTAADDYSLIIAATHVTCLKFIYNSLLFSRKFTKSDIEERYCQLIYDEKLSKQANVRMSKMTAREKVAIESRTPFTRDEEKCLMENSEKILKILKGEKEFETHITLKIEHFKKILEENRSSFHKSRNPQVLSDHFRRIKSYKVKRNTPYTYQAFENPTNGYTMDFDLMRPLQDLRSRFHAISQRPALRTVQVEFTSTPVPDNAVAMIHGRFLQYAMTGTVVVMGRSSISEQVDIDLSKEGPAAKVSRQQAIITQIAEDKFTIKNIGQRLMFVDGKPLPQMVTTSLKHNSIIEVAAIRLIFSIPVPRILHPLTMKIAMQHKKAALERQLQRQQAFQRMSSSGSGSSGGPPLIPPQHYPQKKAPRPKPVVKSSGSGSMGPPGQKVMKTEQPHALEKILAAEKGAAKPLIL